MRMRRAVLALAWIALGCQAQAAIGASCVRPSDCANPLTCSLGRCRPQCADSRDCPIGARCIGGDTLAPVCTLDTENHCDAHVCPSPLRCVDDQCRTTCETHTECVDGECPSGTCIEPTNDGADAGAGDASVAPTPCSITALASLDFAQPIAATEVGIATSHTSDGRGFVHVGVVGGTTGATSLYVLTTVAGLGIRDMGTRDPAIADLTHDLVFMAQMPTSIALRDNHGTSRGGARVVDLIAAFDHVGSEPSGQTVGALGDLQMGAVPFGDDGLVVHENSWLCSLDGAPGACATPTTVHLRPNRVLVVGGAFGIPARFVQRADIEGDGLAALLLSYADDSSGADYTTPATGYLSGLDIDFGSSAGRFIAMPATGDAVAVWDATAPGDPQVFAQQHASGRVAIAASDANHYVLAFTDDAGAIRLVPTYCHPTCDAPTSLVQSTPSGRQQLFALAALTEVPAGGDIALAYVELASPDRVWLELFSASLERRTTAPVLVYTADPSKPNIVDVQIASVADGDHVTFDLAISLAGLGSTTASRLVFGAASAAPTCY